MNLKLKPCISEDADILREMSIRTFYETYAHMNTQKDMETHVNRVFDSKNLRIELNDKNSLFFFLYSDEELAGYLKLNEAPSQTDINDETSLEIGRIYVLRGFQGKGLGKYLMEQAVNIALKRRKKYVWLGVWEKNEKAIRFYKKQGFYQIGTHSFFLGEDEQTDYIMRRDLTANSGGINNVKITEVKDRNPILINLLLNVWESSVKATHLFLSADEIANIKQYVPQALTDVPVLVIAEDENGNPVGFMGIAGQMLEMLFVANEKRGQGIGKQLLQYGIEKYSVNELAVNEQNPQAKGFYEHMGFEVYKRTDHDEQGNPYPLLYMRLMRKSLESI